MAAATFIPRLPEPSMGFRHPRKPDDIFIRQSKVFQRPINSDGSLSTPELYFDDSDDSPLFTGVSPMPPSSAASSYGSSPCGPSYPISPGITLILSPSTTSDSDDDVMEFFKAAAYPGLKSWKSGQTLPLSSAPVEPRTPSPPPAQKPKLRGLPSPVTPKAWTSHEEPPPLPTLPTLNTMVYHENKVEAPPPLFSLDAMVHQGPKSEAKSSSLPTLKSTTYQGAKESSTLPILKNTAYQGVKAGGTSGSSIKIVDVKKPATLQKKAKAKARSSPRSRSTSPITQRSNLGDIAENPPGKMTSPTQGSAKFSGKPSPPVESPFSNIMVVPPHRETSPITGPSNFKSRTSPTVQASGIDNIKGNPTSRANSPTTGPATSQGRSSPTIHVTAPKRIKEDPPGRVDSLSRKKSRAKHQISVRTMEVLAPVLKSPMEIPTLMFSEPDDDDGSETAMTDFEDMSDIEEQTISMRKQKQIRRRSNSVTGVLRTPEQTEYNRFLKPLPKVPQHATDNFIPAPLKIQPHQQQHRDIAIAGLSRDLSSMFRQDLSSRTIPSPGPVSTTSTPPSQPAIIPLPTHRPKISLYPSINIPPPPTIPFQQQQQPLRARSTSPPRSPALIHRDQLHGASFSPTKSPRTVVQNWLHGIKRGDGHVVGRERERSRSRSPKMGMQGMWGRKGGRREEVWI